MNNDDLLLICPYCGSDTLIMGHPCTACWNSPRYHYIEPYGEAYHKGVDRVKKMIANAGRRDTPPES